MPSRSKKVTREVAKLPSIPKELVSLFLTGPMTGEAINAAGLAFKKALVEASLNAELSHHLGYEAAADRPELVTNQRNSSTVKSVPDLRCHDPDRHVARPRRQFRAGAGG